MSIEAMLMAVGSKNNIPEEPGTPFGGGFFVVRMFEPDLTTEYGLVVSTKADGRKPPGTWQPAKDFAENLNSGGFNDWKLPDEHECRALYWAFKPGTAQNDTRYGASNRIIPPTNNYTSSSPSQTSITTFRTGANNESFDAGFHWTETESGSTANNISFNEGSETFFSKTSFDQGYVRAVRRVYI